MIGNPFSWGKRKYMMFKEIGILSHFFTHFHETGCNMFEQKNNKFPKSKGEDTQE